MKAGDIGDNDSSVGYSKASVAQVAWDKPRMLKIKKDHKIARRFSAGGS